MSLWSFIDDVTPSIFAFSNFFIVYIRIIVYSYLLFFKQILLFDSGHDFAHVGLEHHAAHHEFVENVVNLVEWMENKRRLLVSSYRFLVVSLT